MGALNSNNDYDLTGVLNWYLKNSNDPLSNDFDPFSNIKINCKYYDVSSLKNELLENSAFLILNANIQSLTSKFSCFNDMIGEFMSCNIRFDIIALQETWDIVDPDHFYLPGYQRMFYKTRSLSRGGGVCIYVRNGLKVKEMDDLSLFNDKIFESLCIQVEIDSGKKNLILLACILYKPPGNHPFLSQGQQFDSFPESYEELLSKIIEEGTNEDNIGTSSRF